METQITTSNFSSAPVDPSHFEIPAGYKQVQPERRSNSNKGSVSNTDGMRGADSRLERPHPARRCFGTSREESRNSRTNAATWLAAVSKAK